MICMSFVVAVPINQLRPSPRKGSRLLLQCVCACGWLVWSRFIANVIVVSTKLYISLMTDNSS